jgi:hypothetical protein
MCLFCEVRPFFLRGPGFQHGDVFSDHAIYVAAYRGQEFVCLCVELALTHPRFLSYLEGSPRAASEIADYKPVEDPERTPAATHGGADNVMQRQDYSNGRDAQTGSAS